MSVATQPPTFGYVASVATNTDAVVLTVSEPTAYRKNTGDWVDTYTMRIIRLAPEAVSADDRCELHKNTAILVLSDMAEPDPALRAHTIRIVRDADGRPIRRL